MASSGVKAALASLSSSSQTAKPAAYTDLLKQIQASASSADEEAITADLNAFIDTLLADNIGLVSTRPLLTSLIQSLTPPLPSDTVISVGTHLLDSLTTSTATFEEQESLLRENLATAYESSEDYDLAAKTLQGIHLDTTQRTISDLTRVRMWIRITRLYLEVDETAHAESFLNKIKNLPSSTEILSSNPDLKLHFQLSQARILDARHRFLDASSEYLNVSLSSAVDENDRLQALAASITAAVLAPAGPVRSKTLAKLYKDERATSVEEFSILEKMFLDRLLSPTEVEAFAAKLQPHQLAMTSDGSTVLTKAVIEHNLLAASRLYENISTDSLANLLGLKSDARESKGEKAEEYAARMVEQGRLKGVIDQIDGIIFFEHGAAAAGNPSRAAAGTAGTTAATSAGSGLKGWDTGVQGLAEDVERVATGIAEAFPGIVGQEGMVH